MDLLPIILLFLLGLLLIVKGGDFFVDAAVWMAEVSGMPKFLIGATIVSLATTLPELMVSVMGVLQGEVDLAVGNAVGSVTANTGLIMGLSIVCLPAVIRRGQIAVKSLLMAAAALTLLLLCRGGTLRQAPSLILLVIFAAFVFENVSAARHNSGGEAAVTADKKDLPRQIVKFILGIIGIVWGANLLIENGSALAEAIGVPSSIIGVTVVAIGTSLPELVTTITAIVKRESALSIGNIIGANVIDLTLILPVCSLLSGGSLTISAQGTALDLPACFLIILIGILPPLVKERFYRWQGAAMLAAYAGYMVVLVS